MGHNSTPVIVMGCYSGGYVCFFFFVLYDGIMSIIEIKYIHHAFAPDSGFYHFLKVQHDLRFRIEVNLVPEVIEIVLVAQHVL